MDWHDIDEGRVYLVWRARGTRFARAGVVEVRSKHAGVLALVCYDKEEGSLFSLLARNFICCIGEVK